MEADNMADIQKVKEMLEEEYGIRSYRELYEALSRTGKLNIGVFTAPVRKEGKNNGKERSIA